MCDSNAVAGVCVLLGEGVTLFLGDTAAAGRCGHGGFARYVRTVQAEAVSGCEAGRSGILRVGPFFAPQSGRYPVVP